MCPLSRKMTLKTFDHRQMRVFRAGCRWWVLWKFLNPQEFESSKTQVRGLPLDVIYFSREVDLLLESFATSHLYFSLPLETTLASNIALLFPEHLAIYKGLFHTVSHFLISILKEGDRSIYQMHSESHALCWVLNDISSIYFLSYFKVKIGIHKM